MSADYELTNKLQSQDPVPLGWKAWLIRPRMAIAGGMLVIVAAFAAYLGSQQTSQLSYAEYLDEGRRYVEQKQYDKAVESFTRASLRNADPTEALLNRAEALMAQENFSPAAIDLETVLKDHDDAHAMLLLAYCQNRLSFHKLAIEWYRRALDRGVKTVLVYNNLGYSYERSGDFAEAKSHLDRGIAIDSSIQALHHNLARVEHRMSFQEEARIEQAIAEIERAVALGPPSGDLYFDAALIYARGKSANEANLAKAREHMRLAIEAGVPPQAFSRYRELYSDAKLISSNAKIPGSTLAVDSSTSRLIDPLADKSEHDVSQASHATVVVR